MRFIEVLKDKYNKIRRALLEKSGDLKKEVRKMIDDGWLAYDNLTKMYEQRANTKMTKEHVGGVNGFVMKNSDLKKNRFICGHSRPL